MTVVDDIVKNVLKRVREERRMLNDKLFAVHKLNPNGMANAEAIADAYKELANLLQTVCPDSRELSLALTNLEVSCFFAKKAMASQPENQIEENG